MWTTRLLAGLFVLGLLVAPAAAQDYDGDFDGEFAGDFGDYTDGDLICVEHYQDSDIERRCTATEEFGMCLDAALDAYEGCREDSEGLLGFLHCAASAAVDGLACISSLIAELIPH